MEPNLPPPLFGLVARGSDDVERAAAPAFPAALGGFAAHAPGPVEPAAAPPPAPVAAPAPPLDASRPLLRVAAGVELGSGSYSVVRQALYYGPAGDDSPLLCAAKVFEGAAVREQGAEAYAGREGDVLRHLWERGALATLKRQHHPHVVRPVHWPAVMLRGTEGGRVQVFVGCDLSRDVEKDGQDGQAAPVVPGLWLVRRGARARGSGADAARLPVAG